FTDIHTNNNRMNTTLSRKIQKVLEIKLDSSNSELVHSLDELSSFYQTNTLNARRNLRNDIERRYLDINTQFLDQFTLLNNVISQAIQTEQPEMPSGALLPQSLSALQERPLLLTFCLEEIGEYRCKCLTSSFITALTMGGHNGTPRPIEINAHDPLRFLGDMLAWIHQTLASEYELLSALLGRITITVPSKNDDIDFGDASQLTAGGQQDELQHQIKPIDKVLDIGFEAVNRPLTVRVEQILQSKPGITTIYKMITLLDFYSRIASSIVTNKTSRVSSIMNDIKHTCLNSFFTLIKDSFEKIHRAPQTPSIELVPTNEIKESINKLKELITTFNGSLVPDSEREEEFKPILTSMVDPIVNLATVCATTSKLPMASMAVYIINSLSLLQSTLSLHNFTKSRMDILVGQIDAHMDTLVEEQTSELLGQLGLSHKISILQYHDSTSEGKTPLSQVAGMDRLSITQCLRQFDTTLESSFGSLAMPACDKISNTKLKNLAKLSVTNLIVSAYSSLYTNIRDPTNQYDDCNSIFQYTPDQIKKML
ncbi:hypothetical protein SAMD00019534_048320, partial [Acytostelium subglobosum LB1]|uniref:hypothetical protein n=1 Tax=Acytostelium subglobosum LB1 TaxID=1410327 RepID=UPI000644BFE5